MRSDSPPATPSHPRQRLTARAPLLLAALAALAVGTATGIAVGRNDDRLVADHVIAVEGFPEISGLAWCASRGTLIAVSDEAGIAEIGLDGRVLRHLDVPDDVEGVSVDPSGRTAWVLEERKPELLELDLERFEIVARHPLPQLQPHGRDEANLGFEGLAFDPEKKEFVLLHEGQPAALARFAPGSASLTDRRVLDCDHANGCLSGDGGRAIVLSRSRGLRLIGPGAFPAPTPWRRLEATRAEGLALVPGHGLFVAIDEEESQLFVYRDLDTFEKLAEILDGR